MNKQTVWIICLFLAAAIICGPLKNRATVTTKESDTECKTQVVSSDAQDIQDSQSDEASQSAVSTAYFRIKENARDTEASDFPDISAQAQTPENTRSTLAASAMIQLQKNAENIVFPEKGYFISAYNGEIAVFSDDSDSLPLITTGISTSVLRSTDRSLLNSGIWVHSIEEAAALLEDFGS